LVHENLDIVEAAGGAFTALQLASTATVLDGFLTVELTTVKFNPKISAIRIGSALPLQTPSMAPSVAPSESPSGLESGSPSLVPSAVPSDISSVAPSFIPSPSVIPTTSAAPSTSNAPSKATPESTFEPVLINVGGEPYTDFAGDMWQGDNDSNFFTGGAVSSFTISIKGTQDDILYQSERAGIFQYEIQMPLANYEVSLSQR